MSDVSTVPEIPGESELVHRIGELLLTLMAHDAAAITLTRTVIGHSAFGSKWFTLPDGSRRSASGRIVGLSEAIEQLRELMHRPGAGTWYSFTVTVDADGETSAQFDHDHEPEWHGSVPAPPFFERELQMFPRDEAHIPDWFRKGLDGTPRPPGTA